MKKLAIIFTVGLLVQQIMQAQGTIYLSNIDQPSSGTDTIGGDSWLAAGFFTGNNADGYELNSVQLALMDASGNPYNFLVMLYGRNLGAIGPVPGGRIGSLDGSFNPVTGGNYTYTDDSNIILSPNTYYFIVLTAGTAIANGAYDWSLASTYSYNPSDGWVALTDIFSSNNGSYWRGNAFTYAQFAIDATPIPEPSPSWLLLLGGGILFHVRRAFQRKF